MTGSWPSPKAAHTATLPARKTARKRFLTNTVAVIHIQAEAECAPAAVTQTIIICSVAEDTDMLTAPIVISAWIAN